MPRHQTFTIFALLVLTTIAVVPNTVGFEVGEVKGYKLLGKHAASSLYQIESPQIQDGRPLKLLQLVGTHYEAGYAYGALLGTQIIDVYNTFMSAGFKNPIERHILELFLDWQFDNLIVNKIPNGFLDQLRGIQNAGVQLHKTNRLRNLIQRTLVVSSYPGDFGSDIMYAMLDAFMQKTLRIKSPKLLDYVENNLFKLVKLYKKFMNNKRIHCSFMATWGSKTQGGKLYTMRNLDWEANTGLNKYKLITIWKIKDTIPHATIGFYGVIGALTGISQAGLTVHQAGLDSMKATQLGFQWTLRLRYVMMKAHNIAQAKAVWLQTENTFGMNHMVASAADLPSGFAPVFVVQTMRNYNAFYTDLDKREDGVTFVDPKTKKSFKAGFAMKDAVFRTNHAYDPTINKFRTELPAQSSSTMKRYIVLKDSLSFYGQGQIGQLQAINITANVGHKGGDNLYKCPQAGKDNGTNVLSVMFIPGEQRIYAGIEYGSQNTYRTACCGVYLHINLAPWFSSKTQDNFQQVQLNNQ